LGSKIALQNSGKIVVISARSVYRYNTNGSLDSTFGENGKQHIADSVQAQTVAIQSDGKIVVGGGPSAFPYQGYLALARYSGNVTTSAAVHISVVPNKAPVVSIVKPSNDQNFAAPAYIHLEAAASDVDGRITKVQFFNGSTLLRTEFQAPYTYVWQNVPAGSYIITAVATDNWGAHTTSAPVIVRVTSSNTTIVSNRASVKQTRKSDGVSITVAPNPANSMVNMYTTGLQQDKLTTIRVLSALGAVMKTMHLTSSVKTI
jgi:hypothetical protein